MKDPKLLAQEGATDFEASPAVGGAGRGTAARAGEPHRARAGPRVGRGRTAGASRAAGASGAGRHGEGRPVGPPVAGLSALGVGGSGRPRSAADAAHAFRAAGGSAAARRRGAPTSIPPPSAAPAIAPASDVPPADRRPSSGTGELRDEIALIDGARPRWPLDRPARRCRCWNAIAPATRTGCCCRRRSPCVSKQSIAAVSTPGRACWPGHSWPNTRTARSPSACAHIGAPDRN